MSQERPQDFANHAHLPKWFLAQAVLTVIALGVMAWAVVKGGENATYLLGIGCVIHAINTATIFLHLRFTALLLQDRLIRLETRERLYKVLPADLQARIPELTLAQLVSVRFASDAELSELVRKVLDDKITERAAIKKMVKNWQADWMRV